MELGPCSQRWNYMYIGDASRAAALLCEQGTAGIWNVASEDIRPLREYVLAVRDAVTSAVSGTDTAADPVRPGELHFAARPDNAEGPADLAPSVRKLKDLGFRCNYRFEDGIKSAIISS